MAHTSSPSSGLKCVAVAAILILLVGCQRKEKATPTDKINAEPLPTVGTWQMQQSGGMFNEASVDAIQRFTADGKWTLRIQATNRLAGTSQKETLSGNWTLKGDELSLKSAKEAGVIKRTLVAHTRNSLTLLAPDGTIEQFTRIGDPQ